MQITPIPDEQVLADGEGVELKSGEPFLLRCCDCSLVHRVVIVSQDKKSVGLALERVTDHDDWKFKLFLKLRDYYRVYAACGNFFIQWLPGLAPNAMPKGQHVRMSKPTYTEFLHRLGMGLRSPGGRENHRTDNDGTPGRSGIWREDASGQWTEYGAKP